VDGDGETLWQYTVTANGAAAPVFKAKRYDSDYPGLP